MDDRKSTKSLILHACKLAKEFEPNVDRMFDNLEEGSNMCTQIAEMFRHAAERLHRQHQCSSSIDASLHNWLAKSASVNVQGVNAVQPGSVQGARGGELMAVDWLASSKARNTAACSSSSSQRPRRRRDDGETSIVKMAAPQIGNTDVPPDDGYTWRKYGQKEIMGKLYPRCYYRCTHQKQFNCPAKKQVQRDDQSPFIFNVMYRGRHTCHLSATAPVATPLQENTSMTSSHAHPNNIVNYHELPTAYSAAMGSWLSIQAGTAMPEFPVADLADAMFNSGSSITSNSMDFMFPSVEDHKLA